jgi:phage regulator Rha-like protein
MNAIVKFEDLVSVDRRVITTTTLKIAESLGLQHKNVISLVRHYQSDFEEFGLLAFETRPFSTRGGKQHREIAILNEQQLY